MFSRRPWWRNECVTNEPQRTTAGRLLLGVPWRNLFCLISFSNFKQGHKVFAWVKAVLTSLRSWRFLLCFSKQELQPRESRTDDDKENVGGGGKGRRQSPKTLTWAQQPGSSWPGWVFSYIKRVAQFSHGRVRIHHNYYLFNLTVKNDFLISNKKRWKTFITTTKKISG